MAMSTAMMGLSMTNSMSMARDRENLEHNNKAAKTLEDLKNEFEYREQQIAAISRVFISMKNFMAGRVEDESALDLLYKQTQESLDEFEKELKSEVAHSSIGNSEPLQTAHMLELTIQDVFDPKKSLDEKNKSITDFRDTSRNAKHSEAFKAGMGALVGGLAVAALFVTLIAATGGFALFATIPAFFTVLFSLKAACMVGLGACFGARIGFDLSKNQNDERGRQVHHELKELVSARQKLFQPAKPAPEKDETARLVYR